MARGDSTALTRVVHSLKGTVSSLGAQAARDAALQLEVMGRSADLTCVEAAYAELEREMNRLEHGLMRYMREQKGESPDC